MEVETHNSRRILYQSSEKVGPRDVIHSFLFVSNGAGHYLGVHVVSQNT